MKRSSPVERRRIHYSGNVQGVGFRYSARSIAKGFAVVGFVKNLPDGRVQLVAEGAAKELDGFLAAIRERLGDYIVRQDQELLAAADEFTSFEIAF